MSRAVLIPDVVTLPRAKIRVTEDRLRDPDPLAVGVLVRSIEEHGLLTPLIVRRVRGGFELVDGAHRLAALALLRQVDVPVRCYSGPAPAIRLIEIDANLARSDLSDLDRAVFLAARRREYLNEYPETAQGRAGALARWDATAETALASFVTLTAAETGLPDRKVRKLIEAGAALDKAAAAQLRAAPQRVTLNDLLAFSKADPDARAGAVSAFAAGEVKKLAQGLKGGSKPPKDPVEQALQKLREAWLRAPKEARRRFVQIERDGLDALLSEAPE